ncbi:MAG TPA: hypothetical protein VGB00_18755 [Pyrinomonadaceae bacterium]
MAKIKIYFQYFVNTFLNIARETVLSRDKFVESQEDAAVAGIEITIS